MTHEEVVVELRRQVQKWLDDSKRQSSMFTLEEASHISAQESCYNSFLELIDELTAKVNQPE